MDPSPKLKLIYTIMSNLVSKFARMAHFVLCNKAISRKEPIDLIFANVVRLHNLPNDIILVLGHTFISCFWKYFFQLLGVGDQVERVR